jgi:hypothetical protein
LDKILESTKQSTSSSNQINRISDDDKSLAEKIKSNRDSFNSRKRNLYNE